MIRFHKGLFLFLLAVALVFTFCACSQGGGEVEVEKIKLNKTSLTLTSGESFQLVATATPDGAPQEVTWSSSDSSYATVSSTGLVKVTNTGNSSATVKITAKSKADSTKKATCTITVKIAPPEVFTLTKIGMITSGPGEDASRSAVISWHAPSEGSVLEYTEADGSEFVNTKACDGTLSTANWADKATHYRCRVVLENLTPGSTYKYRIKYSEGKYTDVAQFRTAEADTEFQFMWLSDLHTPKGSKTYINRVKELIDLANGVEGVDVDFCLFSGDMVNKGQDYFHWNYWSDSKLMNAMEYAFVCGNHDYYPYDSKDRTTNAYYKDVAAYPYNNTAGEDDDSAYVLDSNYWFLWNGVLFVCIDNFTSEGSETQKLDGSSLKEQQAWFEAVVKANEGKYDYLVYVQHLPFFIDDEPCSYGQYRDWYALFDKYQVDFALSSDEHAYTRTNPLKGDTRMDLTDGKVTDGTVYITSFETEGSSVGTASNQSTKKNKGKYAAFYGGGGVGGGVYFTVTPTEMTMHLICAGGVEKDSVTVVKKDRTK